MSTRHAFAVRREEGIQALLRWRSEASVAEKLAASAFFALLMAIAAQVRVQLPFSPVPFTGQVLVVLLSGFLLGRFAPASMAMYLGFGTMFPWFSGLQGISALTGVTAGYLFGFVAAAAVIGLIADSRMMWSALGLTGLMSLGVLVIYLFGASWLVIGCGMSVPQAIIFGVVPFVVVDAIKVGLAASVARMVAPGVESS